MSSSSRIASSNKSCQKRDEKILQKQSFLFEGAIPHSSHIGLLAAVGELQFSVFAHAILAVKGYSLQWFTDSPIEALLARW